MDSSQETTTRSVGFTSHRSLRLPPDKSTFLTHQDRASDGKRVKTILWLRLGDVRSPISHTRLSSRRPNAPPFFLTSNVMNGTCKRLNKRKIGFSIIGANTMLSGLSDTTREEVLDMGEGESGTGGEPGGASCSPRDSAIQSSRRTARLDLT